MKLKQIIVAVVLVGSLAFTQQVFCAEDFYIALPMNDVQLNAVKMVVQQLAKENNRQLEFGDARAVAITKEEGQAGNWLILIRVKDSNEGWAVIRIVYKQNKREKVEWLSKNVPSPSTVSAEDYYSHKDNSKKAVKPVENVVVENNQSDMLNPVFKTGIPDGYVLLQPGELSNELEIELLKELQTWHGQNLVRIQPDIKNCLTLSLIDAYIFYKNIDEIKVGNYIISARIGIFLKDNSPTKPRGLKVFYKQHKIIGYVLSTNTVPDNTLNDGWYKEVKIIPLSNDSPIKIITVESYQGISGKAADFVEQACIEILQKKGLTGIKVKSCIVRASTRAQLTMKNYRVFCDLITDQGPINIDLTVHEGNWKGEGLLGDLKITG